MMLTICILGLLLFLYHLVADFIRAGNITWYLDSITSLLQSLICVTCLLSFACKLFYYVRIRVTDTDQITIWRSFIPLLVLAGFLLLKLVLCKVRCPISLFLVAACLVATVLGFESHFDNQTYNAPLFLTAIPVLLMFVILAVTQACDVFGQADPYLNFFYTCNSKIKQAFTIFNLLVTLLFSASFVGALYCMEYLDD
jgi:hypothetical protein